MRGIRLIVAMLAALFALGCGIALGAQGESSDSPPSAGPGPEIPADRTATSQTFRLPDGGLEARIFTNPINYRDSEGEWQPIEEGLEEQPDGNGITNGANSFSVDLPEHLGAEPVQLSSEGNWISTELLGPEMEPAQLEGEAATYESANGETAFDFSSLSNGLKEDIEIASASAPSTFHFTIEASAGLTPALVEDGSVEFRDESGRLVATMPAPLMFDSTPGEPAVSQNVHFSMEPQGGHWTLTVQADREWLEAPDRSFPVTIDPTTVELGPSLDCSFLLREAVAWSGNCGSKGFQQLKAEYKPLTSEQALERERSVLEFNTSAIPSGVYVTSTTVGLFAPTEPLNISGIELRRLTKSWESKVNWYKPTSKEYEFWNTPGGDFTSEGAEILSSERKEMAGWWKFSKGLEPIVEGWIAGRIANDGLIVKLKNEEGCKPPACTNSWATFNSSAATESSTHPYLSVTYLPKAPASSKIVSPVEGTVSADRLKLKSKWTEPGVTGISFEYKTAQTRFQPIPTSLVHNAAGESPKWPMTVSGYESEPLYFEAGRASSELTEKGGEVEVRAFYEGPKGIEGFSEAAKAKIDPEKGGPKDATAQVGPGTVDLLTGNYTVSSTDVSISGITDGLIFTRTHNSRAPGVAEDKTVLGRGWKPGAPVEETGAGNWRSVREVSVSAEEKEEGLENYALLTDAEGYEYAFEKVSGTYVAPPELTGFVLAHTAETAIFTLSDTEGNVTKFESSGGGAEYLPVSVSMTGGSTNSSTMVYEVVSGNRRLSKVIAPYSSEITCSAETATTTVGCRSLAFSYQAASTWGAPASYGDRLAKITYYGPTGAGYESMSSWEVAKYEYDSSGRLIAEWDPRISPTLKETYAYVGSGESTPQGGQIKTITPPGQEPWTLEYEALKGELPNAGRLKSVKRASLLESPSVAQTTIAYGVPISGSGAPYEMGGKTVAEWGQTDIPTDATAIFPPTEIPANPPKSYASASVYYMDAEGQRVNTAMPPGAGTTEPSITTTETDEYGNVVRELTAQNRLRALSKGSESKARSEELATKREYSAEGTQLAQEWGPMHQVRLESGSTVQAQLHTTIQYNEGWPGTGVNPHLPTRVTTGAKIPKEGKDADQHVTETKYDWTLRKPTETIVDPGGLNLHTRIGYDSSTGLPTERSLPAKPEGGDAHTTKTIYWTAGQHFGFPTCGLAPQYANLPCAVVPASQPGTKGQPELMVTKYERYNQLSEPTETIESPGLYGEGGTVTRKTITTYDEAGRQTSHKIEGGGTAIPKVETTYSSTQGMPTGQHFVCESECEGGHAYTAAFGTAGSGEGQLSHPADVAIDSSGNLWVIDRENNRLEEFSSAGKFVRTAGSKGSGAGQLLSPSAIAIDSAGKIDVTDTANNRVAQFDEAGKFVEVIGTNVNKTKVESGGTALEKNRCTASSGNTCQAGGGGSAEGEIAEPIGITTTGSQNMFVVERKDNRVEKFNPQAELLAKFGSTGTGNGQLKEPTAIAYTAAGSGHLWVADTGNNRIEEFTTSYTFTMVVGKEGTGNGEFKAPDAIEASSEGNVWAGDQSNRIQEFDSAGKYLAKFGSGGSGSGQLALSSPAGIFLDTKGNLWLADSGNNRVQEWAPFDSQATTTTFDKLGRPAEYLDADGNVSTASYDVDGRPVSTYDGKGTQTRYYDATSGLLTKLEDSAAGTFTAAYNADGAMTEEGLPDGLVAKTTYNEAGEPTNLAYTKVTSCSEKCTWLEESEERSIYGQILSQTSLSSSQQYSYDKAGRLTLVHDTPTGGGCTTRVYAYEGEAGKDSNRTSFTTRSPEAGGGCASSGGTTQKYSYDAADRLTDEGIAYDGFGRITSLPAKDAGGSTLETTFYNNNMVATQSQAGLTNSYQLDATGRPRELKVTGSKEATEVFHYAGGSDSPAWIAKGSEWSRNISGIGGELAAIQPSSGETSLQLTNLHGDVIATASLSPTAKEPTAKFEFDEFGNPKSGSAGRYGWLGSKQRRTELPSGIIQMGKRSYIPELGRFLSVDPRPGASANPYDYANQDPVNSFDLGGCEPQPLHKCVVQCLKSHCGGHNYAKVQNCLAHYTGWKSLVNCARSFCDTLPVIKCIAKCPIRKPPPPPKPPHHTPPPTPVPVPVPEPGPIDIPIPLPI